jgi:hypothetical protein
LLKYEIAMLLKRNHSMLSEFDEVIYHGER